MFDEAFCHDKDLGGFEYGTERTYDYSTLDEAQHIRNMVRPD